MKFGKKEDLSGVDFTLPEDNPLTEKVLSAENNTDIKVYIGPPEWGVKAWVGKIYRSDSKEDSYLQQMATQFNGIELNTLFYGIKTPDAIRAWKDKVNEDFRFSPKFPNVVTHEKKLIGVEAETALFCEAISAFGNNLGKAFIQFSDRDYPMPLINLERYLKSLPEDLDISVEFRHEKWFSNKTLWQETCSMLQELGVGTVITDTAGRRDGLHMTLTNDSLMLRFLAFDLEPSAYTRIDKWCLKIKEWIAKGLKTIYIFVHTHNSVNAPELIQYWVKRLNETSNLRIQEPRIRPRFEQGSLF